MWWAVAVVILILAVRFPKFGLTILVLIGIGGAALFISSENDKRERESAKRRVTASDVELAGLNLLPGYGSGTYTLTGRLRNRSSKYAITSIELRLRMDDCAKLMTAEQRQQLEELKAKRDQLNEDARAALAELSRRAEAQLSADYSRPCETVGEVTESIYVTVPPGQARDLNQYVTFSGLGQPRGEHVWDHEIVEISAR